MGRRLVSYVHVFDDAGEPHAFGPDDDVPQWALAKMGEHCFVQDDESDTDEDIEGEPPRSGKGSGAAAWAKFATANGVDVPEGASREEIIGLLTDAGVVQDDE